MASRTGLSVLDGALAYLRRHRYAPLSSVSNPPGTAEAFRILREAKRAVAWADEFDWKRAVITKEGA